MKDILKIGDTVFFMKDNKIQEHTVELLMFSESRITVLDFPLRTTSKEYPQLGFISLKNREHDTVFKTREALVESLLESQQRK